MKTIYKGSHNSIICTFFKNSPFAHEIWPLVPPPGTQIPRGDNSVDAGKQNGKVTVEKNACQEINTKPGDVSGDETDRFKFKIILKHLNNIFQLVNT